MRIDKWIANVDLVLPRFASSCPGGMGDACKEVLVAITVWLTSGNVNSLFNSAAAAAYADTPGVISYGILILLSLLICSAIAPYIEGSPEWTLATSFPASWAISISDIISLHIPLTEETKNLLDEKKLGLIKKSSVIINAARGGVIDENQLAKLLKENKIVRCF